MSGNQYLRSSRNGSASLTDNRSSYPVTTNNNNKPGLPHESLDMNGHNDTTNPLNQPGTRVSFYGYDQRPPPAPRTNRHSSGDQQCDCSRGGCGPLLANNLAYFGAAAWFIAAVNVKFLPNAPFPVIGNALPVHYWFLNNDVAVVMPLLLWAVHFVRRFTEVLFVHKYTRRMPWGESVGASLYYWGFGFWIGYSANFHLGEYKYFCPTLWILVPGIVLFVIGEVGNCAVHILQRRMRLNRNRHTLLSSQDSSARILPSGLMFRFVSCPNYTFEIISWIGFSLAVFTLAAALFLVASVVTLVIYAHKKHKAYKDIFDGRDGRELYPSNRKALIPFIF